MINYIYDIFNLLTLGNLSFFRNIKYDEKYELDFQISNIKFKDFLYFIGLFLPNIPTLETFISINLYEIFKNERKIFQTINENNLDNENKGYEFVDILGEITVDLLNIENKKYKQITNYIKLINELNSKPNLNEKYHFNEKNKKIIIIITDGKVGNFF